MCIPYTQHRENEIWYYITHTHTHVYPLRYTVCVHTIYNRYRGAYNTHNINMHTNRHPPPHLLHHIVVQIHKIQYGYVLYVYLYRRVYIIFIDSDLCMYVSTYWSIHMCMYLYSQLQIGWHSILRLFLKAFNLVPGVPGFSWDSSLITWYYS